VNIITINKSFACKPETCTGLAAYWRRLPCHNAFCDAKHAEQLCTLQADAEHNGRFGLLTGMCFQYRSWNAILGNCVLLPIVLLKKSAA